jgi:hypothetical protein
MELVSARSNHAAQMEAVFKQYSRLALRAFVRLFFTDKNFDLPGDESAD